ncbi:MAG: polysaccharide deacetylase family protein [Candidatus Krumholzibacteria bacterium]|nr:polysaccharide deacetylase family protein [Candidatus Krumholzibacteria bacterium]
MSASGVGVPVLMYHSVGRVLPDWHWSLLTVPWTTFEDHLRWLSRRGYRAVDLGEVHAHVSGRAPLDERCVALTFDDGYVDNWTFAVPLLVKYGMRGTVCVTPEFVDPRDTVRPTLEDVWAGRLRVEDLETRAFMSWGELARASDTGVLSVQSHAMTHTWYATGPEVVDFHYPGDEHYWLDWNAFPEEKPFYLRDPFASRVPWGTPVYRHAKSLACDRFFPDPAEASHLERLVANGGGERFFRRPGWRETLARALADWRSERGTGGRTEREEERRERLRAELAGAKASIEARLSRPVDHLFWPGGGYDADAMAMALEIYRSVTWSGPDRWRLRNRPGEDARRVTRRGVPFVEARGERVYSGGRVLDLTLGEYHARAGARKRRQVLKALSLAGLRSGLWPRDGERRIPLRARPPHAADAERR